MFSNKRSLYLFLFLLQSVFYMELVLRLGTVGQFNSIGIFISFFFSAFYALLLFLICTLFSNKIRYWVSILLLSITSILFSSQLVYYHIFKTFYSFYSATNANQVLEFWRDAGAAILQSSIWILLFFLPVLVMLLLGRKLPSYEKTSPNFRYRLIAVLIAVHATGLAIVYGGGKDIHSPYDLYFHNSNQTLSMERLGLLTTMRLDMQRTIFGWSPSLEASTPTYPEQSSKDETDSGEAGNEETQDPIGEEGIPTPELEEKVEYNVIDINFDELIANETNEDIKDMHEYFRHVPPTKKNEFTGKFKDYNLIFITAEAFSPFAVHQEATPTLYKLVNEGYYFSNFYTPIWEVSTSDGEYVALTGLLPKSGVWSFQESSSNYLPFVMGNQFNELDYKTVAYHNHTFTYYGRDKSHPNMGYEYKGIGNGLQIKEIWPASDLEMFEATVPEYIHDQPFHAYYMTVSGHMQYSFSGNNMAYKNQQKVQNLTYSNQAKAYIATQIELDRALEHLLSELEQAGIADNTLIALSSDHYPYGLDDDVIDELAGHPVERNFELYKNYFILYTKGMEPVTIDKPSSSLDIIPTLSNLLGLEFDSRLLMGQDIFSDADPLVMFLNRSFITDKGSYNTLAKEFLAEGEMVEEEYIDRISSIINNKFYYSTKILETDYYRILFDE